MCRIVGYLSDEPEWIDSAFVRQYQAHNLGRVGGDTFLTEVLPLPKLDVNAWPYEALWATKREYEDSTRPARVEMLRDLWTDYQSEYMVCYGKTNWDHYRSIFPHRTFVEHIPGESQISVEQGSTIILMLHFSPWGFTNAALRRMLEALPD